MIRRRFGQNFLTDSTALARIVEALALRGDETVVEIGPGRGALTDRLVDRCARLVAIEIDRDLVALLRDRYRDRPHVRIVEADVLATTLAAEAGGPYVLVGNVPYYITTPIIFHALRAPLPQRAVFLVQREVAERLQASPGTDAYGALTVNVALQCHVEMVATVPAGAFFPRPKVDSAVVRLTPRPDALVSEGEADGIRAFVVALFGQRRRQLLRAVRTVTGLDADTVLGILGPLSLDPTVRAETLDPAQLSVLARAARAAGA